MKMDVDEVKEKCGYYIEEHKNQDELFEVLELDVDDMESEEVCNENNESYSDETHEANISIKCETITSEWKFRFFCFSQRDFSLGFTTPPAQG